MSISVETAKAGTREWIGLAVLALPCLLVSMDLTVLYLAVPAISAELKPSASQLLWITDIYGFLIAGSLITMGTLGDRIGRRRLLLMGAVAFGAASVLAAFSTSAAMLIAARAVLGIAGATLMPSTLSLIRNMFHDAGQRTSAIAVWTSSFTVGGMLGPLLGGFMLEQFWWGSVFLLAVPAMALLLVLGPLLLPEFRHPGAERFDFVSAAMSLAAVLAVIYGVKRFAEGGFAWLPTLSIVAGVAIGALFVRRQRRLVHPLIDLGLFAVPAFSAALATNTLSFFVMFGVFLFTAQYIQLVLGFSPLLAGLMTVPSSLAFMAGSMFTPALLRKVRPGVAIAAGLAVGAAGFLAFTLLDESSGVAAYLMGSVISAVGLAPVYIVATDLIVTSAPPARAGAASAISETGTEVGGALGIAILGSLGAAVYRALMASSVPEAVSEGSAEAARRTLGGAIAAAAELPDRLGTPLLAAAQEAFVTALQVAAATSAAIVACLAVLAALLLRSDRGETHAR